jgi:hypothetical protein
MLLNPIQVGFVKVPSHVWTVWTPNKNKSSAMLGPWLSQSSRLIAVLHIFRNVFHTYIWCCKHRMDFQVEFIQSRHVEKPTYGLNRNCRNYATSGDMICWHGHWICDSQKKTVKRKSKWFVPVHWQVCHSNIASAEHLQLKPRWSLLHWRWVFKMRRCNHFTRRQL